MISKSLSLQELAERTQSQLIGNPQHEIESVDELKSACPEDASFLANPRYRGLVETSRAGVICIDEKTKPIPGKNFLVSVDPSRTFQKIAEILLLDQTDDTGFSGIHSTAVIHETVKIGQNVEVGPHVVIDRESIIGDGTIIYSNTSIGSHVAIGKNCTLYSGVIIREHCRLHNHVILQPGVVVGSCGYGYTTDLKTGRHKKIDQMGIVIIEDDVEIGANTTIDRARFKNTLIGKGTKIDNLVQIAHNVQLGENNLIVSQSGIAGSAQLGDNVFLGGQSGVVGHVSITDNVKIATRGGVSKSITQSGVYGGGPVSPMRAFNKRQVQLRNIAVFIKKIAALEKKVEILASKINQRDIDS